MSERITIIIPTRERCDTLRWAIKTCVSQDYDNLEILISDNASTDATRDVIAAFDDSRIRYVNPGRRLGMSEHWEFAFTHVHTGHVGVIGDDDGLLPDAVDELASILNRDKALVWPIQQYFWPSYGDPDLANAVVLPLHQPGTIREMKSRDVVRHVLADYSKYTLLPSPYFGVVPVAAIDRIRARSGRVFNSIIPDIYAGFAIAAVCDTYLLSDKSFSLAGQSKHSNGASQLSGRGQGDANSPATVFDNENTIQFHPDLAYAPSIPLVVTETALQAKEHVELDCEIDLGSMISSALRDPQYLFNPQVRPRIDQSLQQIAAIHHLERHLDVERRRNKHLLALRMARAAFSSTFVQNPLLECDPLVVTNVFDAGQFVATERPRFSGRMVGPLRRFATRRTKLVRVIRAANRRLLHRS